MVAKSNVAARAWALSSSGQPAGSVARRALQSASTVAANASHRPVSTAHCVTGQSRADPRTPADDARVVETTAAPRAGPSIAGSAFSAVNSAPYFHPAPGASSSEPTTARVCFLT